MAKPQVFVNQYSSYQKYKPSGVERLEDIPEHWEVKRLKHHFKIYCGSTPKSNNDDYWDGEITWITPADMSRIQDRYINHSAKSITQLGFMSCALTLIPEGSIIVSTRAPIGTIVIAGRELCHNQGCKSLQVSNSSVNSIFVYYYLLTASKTLNALGTGTTFLELGTYEFRNFQFPLPSLTEQQAISNFLDRETAKIDSLIKKRERMIELLQEKRSALISHAVTKGLDPDVKLKPSGIDWLGDIPEHWKLVPLKALSCVQRGASPRPIDDPIYFDEEGEYAWIRISDVSASKMFLCETEQKLSALGSSLSVKLKEGDLFLSIAGSVGKPCILAIKGCIHDGFVYFPYLKENKFFLYRIFEAGACYAGLGKLGTQLNLNTDTIGAIRIGLPPCKEQQAIVEFLDRETAKIDSLIEKENLVIEKLKEYRLALISEAVSGKIDVRGRVDE